MNDMQQLLKEYEIIPKCRCHEEGMVIKNNRLGRKFWSCFKFPESNYTLWFNDFESKYVVKRRPSTYDKNTN